MMNTIQISLRKVTVALNMLYIIFILGDFAFIISILAKYNYLTSGALIATVGVAAIVALMILSTYLISASLLQNIVKPYLKYIALVGNVVYLGFAAYNISLHGLGSSVPAIASSLVALTLFMLNTFLVATTKVKQNPV